MLYTPRPTPQTPHPTPHTPHPKPHTLGVALFLWELLSCAINPHWF
ncbi:MAG: hypothetical protein F6J93_39725 [Oscillatoria sp. SIO1A7]|nr:hypothetical protein [Oscillatoria sp. SIO1A7]